MGLLKSFFSQCARPTGSLGRVMLSFMNYTHGPLTNWGLGLLNVQDGWTMLDVGCGDRLFLAQSAWLYSRGMSCAEAGL